MPVPVVVGAVAAGASLVARIGAFLMRNKWAAGTFGAGVAAGSQGLEKLAEDLKDKFVQWVVEMAAERAGLHLDPDDPLSDYSFSQALTERTGVPIRTLKDQQSLVEDFEAFAAAKIGDKTGLYLTSLRDPAKMQGEVMEFAKVKVVERTGIPLNDISDRERIKDDVLTWAGAQLYERMGSDVKLALDVFKQGGVDLHQIVKTINEGREGLPPLDLNKVTMAMVNEGMVSQIARMGFKVVKGSVKTRRQLQVREAQRRFRAKHGNRMRYDPVKQSGHYDP